MTFDLSCVKETCSASGQVFFSCSTTAFTPSTVSIRLAPVRFETSMVIAGRPLTRVIEVASLKVGLHLRDVAERHASRPRSTRDRDLQHVLAASRSAPAP